MHGSLFVPSAQARLSVDVAGSGPAVVFVHANVCDKRMWAAQVAAIGASCRAIAYDRRGFGDTDCVAEPHSPVADLLAVLNAVGPPHPAVLVACSGGAKIAIDFAIAHPSRTKALVLISPSVSGAPEPAYAPAIKTLLDAQATAARERNLDGLVLIKARLWLDGPLAPEGRVAGPVRDLFMRMNTAALRAPLAGDSVDTTSMYSRMGEINVPVLLVWGSLDFPHIQARARKMLALVPHGAGLEIPGAAHLPNLEQPTVFNDALVHFLANVIHRVD